MAVVTIRQLLDSGVHFGHQTRRWNPKMKRFIFTERSGIYIIDLQQSLAFIDKAYDFVKETVAHGGTILFVGTKKQAQEIDRRAGDACRPALRQPALARWPPHQLPDRVKAPRSHEGARGARLRGHRQERFHQEGNAHQEARARQAAQEPRRYPQPDEDAVGALGRRHQQGAPRHRRGHASSASPSSRILDTNCDPDDVQYPIPGNDDAIRSVGLLTRIIADAAAEGLIQRHQKPERAKRLSRSPLGKPSFSRPPRRATGDHSRTQSSAETEEVADAALSR